MRRLLKQLPAPWDERALTLARKLKGAATGTPAHGPELELRGQWLREVAKHPRTGPEQDPEGTDPAERAAVRAGWQLVDAYERLSVAGAARVFGPELAAWFDYAGQTVPNLKPWGRPGGLKAYESRTNRLRFRRTMDFVRTGERVFDVGIGRGYLAGVLLRDRELAGYHGIDIVSSSVGSARKMLEANGLESAEVGLAVGDIYDLTREQVEASGASLLICCEVLEHVPDAERALRTLADALPHGADLLFSVPLFGRLENVWGHVSVFDAARLKAMLHGAGLIAHHVEPLANVWTLVLASKSPEPSARVLAATARPGVNVSRPLSAKRDFVDIAAAGFAPERIVPGASCDLDPAEEYETTCLISASAGTAVTGPQASVTFPVDGLESLRLMFRFIDFTAVSRVGVRALNGNRTVARWNWAPTASQVSGTAKKLFALRPGETISGFAAAEYGDVGSADRVQVAVKVRPGESAKFGLRAAYLPTRA